MCSFIRKGSFMKKYLALFLKEPLSDLENPSGYVPHFDITIYSVVTKSSKTLLFFHSCKYSTVLTISLKKNFG